MRLHLRLAGWFVFVSLISLWGARTVSAVIFSMPPNAAAPGGSVDMCVVMAGSQGKVAGTQVNLHWDGTCVSLISCDANPQTGKTLSTRVGGQNCGADPNCLIALLLSTSDVTPMPDAIPIFCCSFVVSDNPPSGTCPFTLTNGIASDPSGGRLPLSVQGGVLSVTSAQGGGGQQAVPVVPAAPVVSAPGAQPAAPSAQQMPAAGAAPGRAAGGLQALPAGQVPEGGGAAAEPPAETPAAETPTVARAHTATPKRTAPAGTPTPRPAATKAATAARSATAAATPGATTPTPRKKP